MSNVRPVITHGVRSFGRRPMWVPQAPTVQTSTSGDLTLFATTFLAAFVFVSMLLA